MATKQMTLSMEQDLSFELHRKATRRDVFPAEMDKGVPWAKLCACIEPQYPADRAHHGLDPRGRWSNRSGSPSGSSAT